MYTYLFTVFIFIHCDSVSTPLTWYMYLFSISLFLRGILLIRPYLLGLLRMRQNTTNTGYSCRTTKTVPLRRYVFTWWYHRVTPVILAVQFLPARTPECNTTNMVYNVTLRVMSVYRIDLGISCSARRLYLNRASPFIPLRRCCFSGIVSGIVFSFFLFYSVFLFAAAITIIPLRWHYQFSREP